MNPQAPPKYTLQQLQQYIGLKEIMTGKKPVDVEVSQEVITWYQEQVKQVAKNLNIATTKNHKEPSYLGVKLVVKLELK